MRIVYEFRLPFLLLPLLGSLLTVLTVHAQTPAQPPEVAGCAVFPADDIWNVSIDTLPVDPQSTAYIASIGREVHVHPDFGSGTWNGGPIGIPYTTVPAGQLRVPIVFTADGDESDPAPTRYPPMRR